MIYNYAINPWVGKIPWRRERLSTPVFWPGESHGITKSRTQLSGFHSLHTPTAICILFQVLSPYSLLHNIELSSLYYMVGPCWLSILYISVHVNASLLIYLFPIRHTSCYLLNREMDAERFDALYSVYYIHCAHHH